MSTIRQHLEALILDDHCAECYDHAEAALAILDAAPFDVLSINEHGDRSTLRRAVPDPDGPAAS